MTLLDYISIVLRGIDAAFYHFRGLYHVFSFDIVGFLLLSLGIAATVRVLTKGALSLSKTIDAPVPSDNRRTQKLEEDHDSSMNDNVSKR